MIFRLVVSFVLVAVVAFATALPLCGQIFGCGCTYQDGIAHCNIFRASEPDCPWCSHGSTFFLIQFSVILLATAASIGASLRWVRNTFWLGITSGVVAYLFWAVVAAVILAVYEGYPLLGR